MLTVMAKIVPCCDTQVTKLNTVHRCSCLGLSGITGVMRVHHGG